MPQWEALVDATAEISAALSALVATAAPAPPAKVEPGQSSTHFPPDCLSPAVQVQALSYLPTVLTCVHLCHAEQGSTPDVTQPSASKAEGLSMSGHTAELAHNAPQGSNGLPIALSSVRRADVSQFKGMTFVNIREYYEVEHLVPDKSLSAACLGDIATKTCDLEHLGACRKMGRCALAPRASRSRPISLGC